jgi:moderate conductance mechanosensitive channel
VIEVLCKVAEELRKDPKYRDVILQPLEVDGVIRLEDSAVVIRVKQRTRPLQHGRVGNEFNRRIKKAFEADGIQWAQRTVKVAASKQIEEAAAAAVRDEPAAQKA